MDPTSEGLARCADPPEGGGVPPLLLYLFSGAGLLDLLDLLELIELIELIDLLGLIDLVGLLGLIDLVDPKRLSSRPAPVSASASAAGFLRQRG